MMTFPKASLIATVLTASAVVHGWTWPSPAMDMIESLRFDQRGAHAVLLAELGSPCSGANNRPNAADWLRASFHDMGTRNASSGLGGLDASIRFPQEFNRPENAGDFIVDTIAFLRPFASRFVSLSDLVALGAVFALEQCGGPHVPYRAGRVDAKVPSPPGLPGPPDALKTLTAKFARAGFTQQEMREMVACGHVIGGVDPHTFPDVIPHATTTSDVVPFDSTENHFDQNMMKEYVAGRSTNPLVVSPNITDRSDFRIFNSDGNVTIKAMAESLSVFNTKCSAIVASLIDAVPADVKLTEVITPTLVKPDSIKLLRNSDGSFNLFGRVRFWGLDAAGAANRTVKLVWASASGTAECTGCSQTLTKTSIGKSLAPVHEALWYEFPAAGVPISSKTSISKFWFEVTEGGHTAVHDQGGIGFPLQTQVTLSADSCLSKTGNTATAKITVPKGTAPSRVFVEADLRATNGDVSKVTHTATLDKTASAKSTKFDTYTVVLTGTKKVGKGTFNVAATIGGKEVSDWSFFDISDVDKLSATC